MTGRVRSCLRHHRAAGGALVAGLVVVAVTVLVSTGHVVRPPSGPRAAGDVAGFAGTVVVAGSAQDLFEARGQRPRDGVVLYRDQRTGSRARTDAPGAEAVVLDGLVTVVRDRPTSSVAPLVPPTDGVLLSGTGTGRSWVLSRLRAGEPVSVPPVAQTDVGVPPVPPPGADMRPVDNDCSAGRVTLTFDDGPFVYTEAVLDHLRALHMHAVFFVIGSRVEGRESVVRRIQRSGSVVGNHTFHHTDLVKGAGDAGPIRPWGPAQIRRELVSTQEVLVAAGVPAPRLYRPPFGMESAQVDDVARGLRLRSVPSWAMTPGQVIVDTRDTEGRTPRQIVAAVRAEVRPGAVVVMHDGAEASTAHTIGALQGIADVLNERHLCTTTTVPRHAGSGAPR